MTTDDTPTNDDLPKQKKPYVLNLGFFKYTNDDRGQLDQEQKWQLQLGFYKLDHTRTRSKDGLYKKIKHKSHFIKRRNPLGYWDHDQNYSVDYSGDETLHDEKFKAGALAGFFERHVEYDEYDRRFQDRTKFNFLGIIRNEKHDYNEDGFSDIRYRSRKRDWGIYARRTDVKRDVTNGHETTAESTRRGIPGLYTQQHKVRFHTVAGEKTQLSETKTKNKFFGYRVDKLEGQLQGDESYHVTQSKKKNLLFGASRRQREQTYRNGVLINDQDSVRKFWGKAKVTSYKTQGYLLETMEEMENALNYFETTIKGMKEQKEIHKKRHKIHDTVRNAQVTIASGQRNDMRGYRMFGLVNAALITALAYYFLPGLTISALVLAGATKLYGVRQGKVAARRDQKLGTQVQNLYQVRNSLLGVMERKTKGDETAVFKVEQSHMLGFLRNINPDGRETLDQKGEENRVKQDERRDQRGKSADPLEQMGMPSYVAKEGYTSANVWAAATLPLRSIVQWRSNANLDKDYWFTSRAFKVAHGALTLLAAGVTAVGVGAIFGAPLAATFMTAGVIGAMYSAKNMLKLGALDAQENKLHKAKLDVMRENALHVSQNGFEQPALHTQFRKGDRRGHEYPYAS